MAASRRFIREWVAGKLGRLHRVNITVDGVDTTLYDVPSLGDVAEDRERFLDSYLMIDDATDPDPEWRRLTAVSADLSQVSINRAFTAAGITDQAAIVYGLLNPDEWNDSINEALTTLYFTYRHEIEITVQSDGVTLDSEYLLPSWVFSKGQVSAMLYRNTSTGVEVHIPRVRLQETLEGVTLHLLDSPWSNSTYTIIVEATRYHSRLDQDDWGTTCPQPLWQAEVEVAALHKVMKKYGQRFKAQFAQDLAIAERERMQQRAACLPTVVAREYTLDDAWDGSDIDQFFATSGWA